jgi:hypothetical protein
MRSASTVTSLCLQALYQKLASNVICSIHSVFILEEDPVIGNSRLVHNFNNQLPDTLPPCLMKL